MACVAGPLLGPLPGRGGAGKAPISHPPHPCWANQSPYLPADCEIPKGEVSVRVIYMVLTSRAGWGCTRWAGGEAPGDAEVTHSFTHSLIYSCNSEPTDTVNQQTQLWSTFPAPGYLPSRVCSQAKEATPLTKRGCVSDPEPQRGCGVAQGHTADQQQRMHWNLRLQSPNRASLQGSPPGGGPEGNARPIQ